MKTILIIFSVVALGLILLLDQVACIKNISLAMGCEEHLKNTYQHLVEYGKSNDGLPKTPTGNVDLDAVFRFLSVSPTEDCLCTTDSNVNCYTFRSGISFADLTPCDHDSDAAYSIIATEQNLNHAEMNGNFRTTGRFHVVAMSANSTTRRINLEPQQHDELLQRLVNGEQIDIRTIGEP